ncbi:MAG: type II toxin-antitoxin system RelE/ParE family toxin [Candidatus Gracilibacteria bacterium]|jgi:mRNA-degrading endonuclease RelE of RelBE toxin-antitoxin system
MKKIYQFQFSKNAERQFADLEVVIQKRIVKKLDFYEKSADPFLFAKKLKGLDDKFSFRIGDYRVIVVPKNDNSFVVLVILKIGHRREVYDAI